MNINLDRADSKSKAAESDGEGEASGGSAMSVDSLRKYLAEKLGISDKDEEKIKILDSVSLDGIADYVKNKKCKNVITMAGAGISTCNNYIEISFFMIEIWF